MKAAVLENNKFNVKDIEKPSLEKYGQGAIVKVLGCGLCGSDIVKIRDGLVKDGAVLGHEVVGEIVEINSNTKFETGDKIALGHHVPCFDCIYCWHENFSMCRHFKATNIRPGGFSEYIFVSEEHLQNTVFSVDCTLTDIEASFLEPLACCIRAVKRANIRDNSNCLVIGLGSVGILMGEALNAFGHRSFGCDLKQDRVDFSKKYGFEESFVSSSEDEVLEQMKKYAPFGFDVIFLTAGAAKTIDFAVKAARDGAKIVVFSSVKDTTGFMNNDIYYKELTVMGSYSPSPMDLEDSMKLISQRNVKVSGISVEYPVKKLNEAIEDTLSNKIMKAFIKL